MESFRQLLKLAETAAKDTGKILRGGADKHITLDTSSDVKLKADEDSETLIRRCLAPAGLPIIGEELGGDASLFSSAGTQLYWVVDPLDGTFNYQRGQPLTCVSIGLMRGDEPVLGVIYNFNADECITGIVGEGISINGEKIVPAWASELSQACLMTGFPAMADKSVEALEPFFKQVSQFKKIRMIGTAALAVAYVATGKAEVYQEESTNLWDIAAGIALVKAAGGFYKMSLTGKRPLNLNLRCAARSEWL